LSSTLDPKHGTIKSKTQSSCTKSSSHLRKQEKLQLDAERVKLHQEKVLEEKPQGDLLEGENARASSFFILF